MASQQAPMRRLGRNGPMVPALGLGTMGLSMAYGVPPSDEDRFKILDRAYELGCTNWDSADLYGDSEELLNKWFKRTGKRNSIFLATKFGFKLDGQGKVTGIDSSADYAKQACDRSLQRLGVDCIDLYYVHRVNHQTSIEETVRAMADLKKLGKIRYLGLSEVSSDTLRRAYKVHPIDAVQIEYSAFVPDIEGPKGTDLLATCRELGVAVVAYSPLGRGMLTGAIKSASDFSDPSDSRAAHFPMFNAQNLDANLALVDKFTQISLKKACTPAQLALAWLLQQGDDIIPIPGTKKMKYLEENWEALKVQLSVEENAEVREFVNAAKVAGTRYSEMMMPLGFGNTKEDGK